MPRFSAKQIDCLKSLRKKYGDFVDLTLPDHNAESVSCWKLALFGLAETLLHDGKVTETIIHRPAILFDAIAQNGDIDKDSCWAANLPQIEKEREKLKSYYGRYGNVQPRNYDDWRKWRMGIMKEACERISTYTGMRANGYYDYTLVMHYYDISTDKKNVQTICPPNETHWWLEIPLGNGDYVSIETFPQKADPPVLNLRFNSRFTDVDIIRVPISYVLNTHIDLIPDSM